MTARPRTTASASVPRASALDTIRALVWVLVPLVGRGVIVRRPRAVALAERLDLDGRAVRQLQRFHQRYGAGPLVLRLPSRRLALVLDPEHVHRVLRESPEPFATANREKQHALAHFQPRGVLISHGAARERRRELNETVLDTHAPVHHLADELLSKAHDEMDGLAASMAATGQLDWDGFIAAWARMVRRVTLGEGAANDDELAEMLTELRENANWSYLRPKDDELRRRFLQRLRSHVERREPGCLIQMLDTARPSPGTVPHEQVPQWLFAFEPAGMATIRTLALLSTHPGQLDTVRAEVGARDLSEGHELAHTRACVLDALRLWPTTPAILRDTTVETTWERGRLAAGSGLLIFTPYFHRDERRLSEAHRFAPELWSEPRSVDDWPLVPFSAGPVVCPGQPLVLLLASTFVGRLVREYDLQLRDAARLDRSGRLPSVLSPFDLQFRATRRSAAV